VIKFLMFLCLCLGGFAVSVAAQDSGPIRCVVTVYRETKAGWKLDRSVEFYPKMAEEELTNRTIRLTGHQWLVASVFPTDESMRSAKGADSIRLGLGLTRNLHDPSRVVDDAVAEVTLNGMDTARVERILHHGRLRMLTRLECWDSGLEKKFAAKD
jgi:hypothetical protein